MSDDSIHAPLPEYILEENKPFSQSLIWKLQRQFYVEHGANAWSQMRVPFGITTNPLIAMNYSRVIYGFLRDMLSQIDLSEPVYIIEVGAGSGRLGFNILNQLDDFYSTSAVKQVPYQYILTDLAEKNIEFWKSHPQLAEYVDAGKLDFARFDLINDTEITLELSGKKLVSGTLKNPIIVIANYIWDTLPVDLFYVEDGQLFEVQAALLSDQPETNLEDPELITRIEIVYDRFPTTTDFYRDPEMQQLLEMYRQEIDDSMLVFPRMALECIRGLLRLSNNKTMLLTADKGEHRISEMINADIPPIPLHDNGFSTQFNFHAIMKFFEFRGSTVLTTTQSYNAINILACLLGDSDFAETRHAYRDYIERISPDDMYMGMIEFPSQKEMKLSTILTYLRLKQYDSHAFIAVYNLLLPLLSEKSTRADAINLQLMLHGVWRNYYHLNERYNLPLYIATILQTTHDFSNALGFYNYAVQLYGTNTNIRVNIAKCHFNLGNREKVLDIITQLLTDEPNNDQVKQLKAQFDTMPA